MGFIVLRTDLDHLTIPDMTICFKNKKASGKWMILKREHEIL